jgi:hypothetical protein
VTPSSPLRISRQAYHEWVEERVEEFKESIPREDLLRLADEVVHHLEVTHGGQYQLTELLLCEAIDREIVRRLGLPGYAGWRSQVEGEFRRHGSKRHDSAGRFDTKPS